METVQSLTSHLGLGAFLARVDRVCGHHRLLEHAQQGEFHHDLVLELPEPPTTIPGRVLVVATNCNGGVKEVLCFADRPSIQALWHHRCPENPEFQGVLPTILASARTAHWFDPCALLAPDARSELRPEARERQPGGGWRVKSCGVTQPTRDTEQHARFRQ
jgi:hypothetical protein